MRSLQVALAAALVLLVASADARRALRVHHRGGDDDGGPKPAADYYQAVYAGAGDKLGFAEPVEAAVKTLQAQAAFKSRTDARGNSCANAIKPALDAYNTAMTGLVAELNALDSKAVGDMKTLLGSSTGKSATGSDKGSSNSTSTAASAASGSVSALQANAGKGDDKKKDSPFKAWQDTVLAGFTKQLQASDAAHDALEGELKKQSGAAPCNVGIPAVKQNVANEIGLAEGLEKDVRAMRDQLRDIIQEIGAAALGYSRARVMRNSRF